jgi:hypothetical protein
MGANRNEKRPRDVQVRGHGHKEMSLVSNSKASARRPRGTGRLYKKSGAWYGRW